jgi:tRNA(Ile)-lysidine synthase
MLAAVSGGGDSMAMLALLKRFYSGEIKAAHLEHGLRGGASLADAEFVAVYCAKIGVPCFVRRLDVMKNRLRGESAEMSGRRARYEFFFELLEREGLPFVATAHNSQDVVETVLFNLFRGSGVRGLSGIAGRRGKIVRPVITCSRDDLRRFLADSGIPWREDETNAENHYQRNKIRNQLLPWVRSNINKSADRMLLGLVNECSKADIEVEDDARGLLAWISRSTPPALASWDAETARRLSGVRLARTIRAQGARLGLPVLDRRRLDELRGLVGRPGRWRFQWAKDVEVCGGRAEIGWLKRADLVSPEPETVKLEEDAPISMDWGAWRIELCLTAPDEWPGSFRRGAWSAFLSADGPCEVSISSAEDILKKKCATQEPNSRLLGEIPWWSARNRPALFWPTKIVKRIWIPGIFNSMQCKGRCVIIAKVFCRDEFATKGVFCHE